MTKIPKKKSKNKSSPGPPKCASCVDGKKIPDAIHFDCSVVGERPRLACAYCMTFLPWKTTDKLDGITLRSAVMAERANAK